jgi:hypothetical protein
MAETERVAIITGAGGGNRQGNDAGSAGGRSRSGAVGGACGERTIALSASSAALEGP